MRLKKEKVIANQIPIREKGKSKLIANQIAIRVAQLEHDRHTKAFAKDVESELYIMDLLSRVITLPRPVSSPSNGVPMMKNDLNSGKTVGHSATNISRHKRSHADMQLDNGESREESEHDRFTKALTKDAESLDTIDRNLADLPNLDGSFKNAFPIDLPFDIPVDWNFFDGIDRLSNGYSPSETNEDQIEMEEEGGVTGVGLAEDKAAAGKPDATECSNVTSEDGNGVGLVGDKSDDSSSFLDIRQPVGRHDPIPSTSSNYDMETEGIGVTSVDRNVTAQKMAPRLEWTNKGTERLIALYKNNIPRMTENPNEKRQVWEDIATDLQEIMPGVTSQQVRIKWKNLKDLPKKLDDGKVKKEPPYYDFLCSVLKLPTVIHLPSLKAGPSTETIDRRMGRVSNNDLDCRQKSNMIVLETSSGSQVGRTRPIIEKAQLITRMVKSQLGPHSLNSDECLKDLTTMGTMVDNLSEIEKTNRQSSFDKIIKYFKMVKFNSDKHLYYLQQGIEKVAQQYRCNQKDIDMYKEYIKKLEKKHTDDWFKTAAEDSYDLVEDIKVQKEMNKVESFMETFVSKLNSNLGENTFKMQPERIEKSLNTFTSKVESLVKLEETFQRKESDLHQKMIRQNKEYIETLKGYDQELNRLGVVKETFQCKCVNQQVLKPLTTRACAV